MQSNENNKKLAVLFFVVGVVLAFSNRRRTGWRVPRLEEEKLGPGGIELAKKLQRDNGLSFDEAIRWAKAHKRRSRPDCDDYRGGD